MSVRTLVAAVFQDNKDRYMQLEYEFRTELENLQIMPFQLQEIIREFTDQILEESRLQLEDDACREVEYSASVIAVSDSFDMLWTNIFSFLDTVYDAIAGSCREKYARPVRDAQSYIQQHYSDSQISLNSVAEYVGLNGNYFSGLFKKNCCVGFAEYLQGIRLDRAKELLTKTNDPIKQISAEIGYSDPKHFSKIFKSATGIKPNEYRRLYE